MLVAVVAKDSSGLLFVPQVVETINGDGAKPLAQGEPCSTLAAAMEAAKIMKAGILAARSRKKARPKR